MFVASLSCENHVPLKKSTFHELRITANSRWDHLILTCVSHLCVPAAINRADIQDTDMEAIMDTIVDSLFCFFVTLGEFVRRAAALRFF